jgi:hypothetical protein
MNKNIPITVLSPGLKYTLMCAGLTMLAACASNGSQLAKGGQNNPVILAMTWKAVDACTIDKITPDASLCKESFPEFCIPRSKWVEWRSTPAKKYKVYFSPFNTGSFNAGSNGRIKGKIDDDAPYAIYKYTIVADGCDPETQANDPGIRVNK